MVVFETAFVLSRAQTTARGDLGSVDPGCSRSASQWDPLKCQCKKKKRNEKEKTYWLHSASGFWHRPVNKSVVRTQVVSTALLRNHFSKSPAGLFLMTDKEEFFFFPPIRPETQLTAGKTSTPQSSLDRALLILTVNQLITTERIL